MEGKKKKIIMIGLVLVLVGLAGFNLPNLYDLFAVSSVPLQEITVAETPTFEEPIISPEESDTPVEIVLVTSLPSVKPSPTSKPEITPKPEATVKSVQIDLKDRLIISGVNINMPVFVGDTDKILNKGGWLFPRTSRPDRGSNTVIFGHRYMYRPPKSNTFWNLDKVKIGDEMVLFWQGKEYKYRVFETKIVEPTDLSVMQPSSGSRLTVITCTPLFTTKQRLVVVGELVQ